ncbi:protoheme IX farnesyltransferase [bacterium]|nr:protoheme IX farnesyltransferase [bacterium]
MIQNRAFALYARVVVAATVLLIFVGALVTTKGAGLAVPDWPLSFGKLNPAMVGGVLYEHGHRLVASGVGFLTLVLALWAQFSGQDLITRRLSWLALGLVIVQGLLGGLTVLLRLPRPVSIAHGCTAQLFFLTTVAVALYTTTSFRKAQVTLVGDRASALRLTGFLAVGVVLIQLLIAATMRHMGAGLVISDFPTSLGRWIPPFTSAEVVVNYTHRVMAVVVLTVLCFFAWRVFRERDSLPRVVMGYAAAMVGFVLLQITLGAYTVWTARALIPTSWHVVNGALVLGTTFATWMWVMRVCRHHAVEGEDDRPIGVADVSVRDWKDLFKVKLVGMSVITAALSFWAGRGCFDLVGLLEVSLGVGLIGSGAGALNQLLEIEVDRLMSRTCNRPIPAGRIAPNVAEFWGCALSTVGTLFLGLALHPLAGLLAALAVVLYAFVYTPLKRISSYNTLIGAVPGALPVLVGWSAATGGLEIQGWVLFFILFLWQLPHFMAIAWLCKDDYARAGLPMVTVLDPGGHTAAVQAVAYALALLPVSLAPALCGLGGPGYLFTALILGLVYLYAGVSWAQSRTTQGARKLLLTSVVYLPLLFGAMVFC